MLRFSKWAVGLLLGTALLAPTRHASAQAYVIVVNDEGPSTLSKDDVSRIFLKKSGKLMAVDQTPDSKTRAAFSSAVHGRPVSAVRNYWQQQIFSGGDTPPVEKTSDADVLTLVRSNPKAIGYVAAGTPLGAGVKVLTVQ